MKILWVEDIPSGKEAVKKILKNYDPDLKVVSTYQDSLSEIEKALESYDVIFLDINLTGTTDTLVDDSKIGNDYLAGVTKDDNLIGRAFEFKLKSANQFLVEAGFHVYIELIDRGYPKGRIAFISANNDTYGNFSNRFKAARMEPPKSFDSSKVDTASSHNNPLEDTTQNSGELNEWLENRNTDYIKLRRGIIDTCEFLLSEEKWEHNPNLRIGGSRETVEKKEIKNSLLEIGEVFKDHIQKPKDLPIFLKRIARVILHDWEAYQTDSSDFGNLLKLARNFIAHDNEQRISVSVNDVAFLFIMNCRALVETNDGILKLESSLMQVFEPTTDVDGGKIAMHILKSYVEMYTLRDELLRTKKGKKLDLRVNIKSLDFFGVASYCRQTMFASTAIELGKDHEGAASSLKNGMQPLYQGFFHSLFKPECVKVMRLNCNPATVSFDVKFNFNYGSSSSEENILNIIKSKKCKKLTEYLFLLAFPES